MEHIEEFEIPIPVISVSKGERYAFNAHYTINPSLTEARARRLPMVNTLKAFAVGTTYTTLEFVNGVMVTMPNRMNIKLVKSIGKGMKPGNVTRGEHFKGVSIE